MGGGGGGRFLLECQGAAQHLPSSDDHQLPKQNEAQAVTEQPSSAAWKLRPHGSRSNLSRCPTFCTVTLSPALPSRM